VKYLQSEMMEVSNCRLSAVVQNSSPHSAYSGPAVKGVC
jgi:hypothetical protein